MDRVSLLLYLTFCTHLVKSHDCPPQPTERSWEGKLHAKFADLQYNFDTDCQEPPKTVTIFFVFRYIAIHPSEDRLIIQSWVLLIWKDKHIQWLPDEFGGLKTILLNSSKIWIPNFMKMNSDDANSELGIRPFETQCIIKYSGGVSCVPQINHEALCTSDLTNWPYDKLECTVIIGSYEGDSGPNYTFPTPSQGASVSTAYIVDGWSVQGIDYDNDNETRKHPSITFKLERRAQDLEVLTLTPILITVTFLIVSLFMNVDSNLNLRMLIVCFCIYLHAEIVSTITFMMPKHSSFIPKILTFLRISVVINCVLMFISLVLGRVVAKEYPAPIWIGAINNSILESKAKYIVITSWRPKLNEEDSKYKFAKEWVDFANIFNAISGLIVCFVYLCILKVYVPWPQNVENKLKILL